MINLPLDELLEKVDSRYTLVSVIAARAREIVEHPESSCDAEAKPVTAAAFDLLDDRLTYERSDEYSVK